MTKRKWKEGGIQVMDFLVYWSTDLHYLELNDWIHRQMIEGIGKSGSTALLGSTLTHNSTFSWGEQE